LTSSHTSFAVTIVQEEIHQRRRNESQGDSLDVSSSRRETQSLDSVSQSDLRFQVSCEGGIAFFRGRGETGSGIGPHLDSVRWTSIVINVGSRMLE
jgi:hypothetical protein